MEQPSSKRHPAASAFVQSAGAKLLIIGLNAGTSILTARALAPSGGGELSAMILWAILLGSVFSLPAVFRRLQALESSVAGAEA
jgi:hypothetical protein